ncbi:MAG: hypothetical protein EPN61_08505 [Burkholderiaceae bacterium]|nr:MAG: hypothetical protein EPN61_08505 [Burkholderiaceae bacterium]
MSTRKSLVFSFLDRYASLAISIVSSMVIARLLTPTEIGVFSVTMVRLMFVSTVRDLGAGQYLIQEKELTTERIRAVWAVQLGRATGLGPGVRGAELRDQSVRLADLCVADARMRSESIALTRFSAGLSEALDAQLLVAEWGHIP